MISYAPLWKTMKKKGATTYTLRNTHGFGTVRRLQKNESVSTNILNDLCKALQCSLWEVAEYVDD